MDFVFAVLYSSHYRMFYLLEHEKQDKEDCPGL